MIIAFNTKYKLAIKNTAQQKSKNVVKRYFIDYVKEFIKDINIKNDIDNFIVDKYIINELFIYSNYLKTGTWEDFFKYFDNNIRDAIAFNMRDIFDIKINIRNRLKRLNIIDRKKKRK